MSRKGNKLLTIPSGVTISVETNNVILKGTQGTLSVSYPPALLKIEVADNKVKVNRLNDEKEAHIFQGTVNSNINNALIGLSKGFVKKLKIVGVGYKANVSNGKLNLAIGFSHPIIFNIPNSLKVICPTPTEIIVEGYDKIVVGEFTANVRRIRPPEPYNGKGIMYSDEIIIRKVGKTAEGATTAVKK